MFKRGYILGRKGRFWDQKALHIITKKWGLILGWRGRLSYGTQFDLDEIVDLYSKLHTRRLELALLL